MVLAVNPCRADGMENIFRRELISRCGNRLSGVDITDLLPRLQQFGACRLMDGIICPAADDRLRIGSVDDGICGDL